MKDRFWNTLNYSSSNEDGETERRALNLSPTDTVCCITGSGDRVLNLLLDNPARIFALDMNPAQNHLLELKAAAIRASDYPAYARFLGLTDAPAPWRLRHYATVRQTLSPAAAAFFDQHIRDLARGVLYAGRWERFFALSARNLRVQRGEKIAHLFACKTLDEQRAFLRKSWDTAGWRYALHLAFSRPVLRFAFGDPGFYSRVRSPEPTWQYIHTRINRYLDGHPARSSFMLALVFNGRFFDPLHYPPYLREENFALLKSRLDRIVIRTASLFDFLATEEARTCTAFSLSDVSSFLTDASFARLIAWFNACDTVRFCLRDFLARRPHPQPSATDGIRYFTDLERELENADASIGYSFVIGGRP